MKIIVVGAGHGGLIKGEKLSKIYKNIPASYDLSETVKWQDKLDTLL